MLMSTALQSWVDRIRSGEVRALARAISTIEDNRPESRELLKALFNYTGQARVIGLTGAPGAGKSTLVDQLAREYRKQERTAGIIAVDPGHGGDPHVRNLIRRFVEAGVPGYHIEDQRPGTKKCGHQGGKVLVAQDEQNKRLNAARFQLDVMNVPGIIVARTDAEAANLIDGRGDERDQPFLLGATNLK